jgi:hypothetical protein
MDFLLHINPTFSNATIYVSAFAGARTVGQADAMRAVGSALVGFAP